MLLIGLAVGFTPSQPVYDEALAFALVLGIVHTLADVNPVTLVVYAARALTIGHEDVLGPTLGTLAWLAALLLIFVLLSVRAFRRV